MVAEMGGLAEKQIADAVDALTRRDAERAQRSGGEPIRSIDALQAEIEEKAVLTIARRQPMAVDLREIVGALRVVQRSRAHRRPRQEHRQAGAGADGDFHPPKLIRGVEHMARAGARAAQAGARRLCRRTISAGAGGLERRRGDRRALHLAVPRAAYLHDGRPAQHHVLHPPDVLRQEHRAHGRSRDQHRRDRTLHDRRTADRRPAAEGRHHERSPPLACGEFEGG